MTSATQRSWKLEVGSCVERVWFVPADDDAGRRDGIESPERGARQGRCLVDGNCCSDFGESGTDCAHITQPCTTFPNGKAPVIILTKISAIR